MKRTITLLTLILLFSAAKAQTWTAMSTGLGSGTQKVKAIAVTSTGAIYAGGDFTGSINYISKWNSSTSMWEAVGGAFTVSTGTPVVNAIVYRPVDGGIYVAGYFDNAGGVAVHNIAKWNGSSWSAVGNGLNNTIYALLNGSDGFLYAAGSFSFDGTNSSPLSKVAKYDGTWVGVGSGITSGGVSTVYALAEHSGSIYAGTAVNTGSPVRKFNGSSWVDITGISNGNVYCLASFKGYLYAGGTFSVPSQSGAKYDGTNWSSMITTMSSGTKVYALWTNGTYMVVGGTFSGVGVGPCYYIAKVTNYNVPFLNLTVTSSNLGGEVDAISNVNGKVIAGGAFTTPGNKISITDINIGIEETNDRIVSQTFFPNPMLDKATLRILTKDHVNQPSLRIMDAQGRIVNELPAENNNTSSEYIFNVERENMSAGIYYYSFQSEGEVLLMDKFIVQ